MPKYKPTVEDDLKFLRRWRSMKGLMHREGRHYLKDLRRERGLTQKQLAECANVTQQYISRIESNWVNAGPKTIHRLAAALEMDRLELTLIELIYRRTFAMGEYDPFEDRYALVEGLDVDQWTLGEAVNRGAHLFYPTYDEWDEERWSDPGIQSQEEADRANTVLRRLRERYASREERDEDDWWE